MKNNIQRKWLTVGIILLFVGTIVIPSTAQDTQKPIQASRGNWLYVGGSGPGNYSKIQNAIDNASDGDTVFVYSGFYNENIVINKSIVLSGQHRDTTIIIGENDSDIIQITDCSLELEGFTIQGQNEKYVNGVTLRNCWSSHIHENYVKSFYTGIVVFDNELTVVSNNTIQNCEFSILLYETKNIAIKGNIIDGNGKTVGVIVGESIHTNIIGNNITNSLYGIELEFSYFTSIQENNFIGIKEEQAYFLCSYFSSWYKNYWGQSYVLPKIISGVVGGDNIRFIFINIDWRPAREPYDIPGMT